MKNNNKGVTIVEVIIVVAIIGVLVSASVLGFGFYTSYPAKQCANNIKTSLINGRITALGKNGYTLIIGKESDGTVYIQEEIDYGSRSDTGEKVNIGEKAVSIGYYIESDPTLHILANGSKISFKFKRETGGFDFPAGSAITKLEVTKQKTFTIALSRFTGKVTLE